MTTSVPIPQPRKAGPRRECEPGERPVAAQRAAVALSLLICFAPWPAMAGEKRVEIDKTYQVLRAYEGDELVFESRVSTGKPGHSTPSGNFRAGVKLRMHYSRRYNNAPMPYSVQVSGHYFIHGYKDVPPWPASHGCIRVPLDGENPAAWFYAWVDAGTPITISGQWQGRRPSVAAAARSMDRAVSAARGRQTHISANP